MKRQQTHAQKKWIQVNFELRLSCTCHPESQLVYYIQLDEEGQVANLHSGSLMRSSLRLLSSGRRKEESGVDTLQTHCQFLRPSLNTGLSSVALPDTAFPLKLYILCFSLAQSILGHLETSSATAVNPNTFQFHLRQIFSFSGQGQKANTFFTKLSQEKSLACISKQLPF